MTSHYSRKDSPQKRFLSPDLSVSKMYNLYLEAHEPEILAREKEIVKARRENLPVPAKLKPVVGEHTYRRVFNSDFNLGFGRPRTDTCATCDKLNLTLKSNPGNTVARRQLADHQDMADEGYQSMRDDKNLAVASWSDMTRSLGSADFCSKDGVDVISFDFMQNLPTPNLSHNDVFYQHKLWTYVFGIHDLVVEKGYMYLWDETIAKRGSSEVASCLEHFFHTYRTGAKSLVSYSDGCGGQNKNLTIVGLYNDLHTAGVYNVLNHKFLTRGHTFLRNDSDFAQIERRKTSATVYLPSDWYSVVKEANRRSPFEVISMHQRQFLTYKDFISSKYTNRHFSSGSCSFRDVHWLNFGWGEELNPVTNKVTLVHHPNEVWMRNTYSSEEPWRKVKILKDRAGDVSLEQLYHSSLVLSAKKVRDLKAMARSHIPLPQRNFYLEMDNPDDDDGSETEDLDSD